MRYLVSLILVILFGNTICFATTASEKAAKKAILDYRVAAYRARELKELMPFLSSDLRSRYAEFGATLSASQLRTLKGDIVYRTRVESVKVSGNKAYIELSGKWLMGGVKPKVAPTDPGELAAKRKKILESYEEKKNRYRGTYSGAELRKKLAFAERMRDFSLKNLKPKESIWKPMVSKSTETYLMVKEGGYWRYDGMDTRRFVPQIQIKGVGR